MTPTKRKSTTPYRAPCRRREITIAVAAAIAVLVVTATRDLPGQAEAPRSVTDVHLGPDQLTPGGDGHHARHAGLGHRASGDNGNRTTGWVHAGVDRSIGSGGANPVDGPAPVRIST